MNRYAPMNGRCLGARWLVGLLLIGQLSACGQFGPLRQAAPKPSAAATTQPDAATTETKTNPPDAQQPE